MTERFTASRSEGVASRRIVHAWDSEVRGFGGRVLPSGRRVYVLKYRSGTRQRWLRLGDHGDVTTEQARGLARKRLGHAADGRDRAAEIRNARDEREQREAVELPCVVAALRLLVLTGARISEVLSLRWEHVGRVRGVLRLADSKTGAKEIPLGAAALDVLDGIRRTTSPWVIAGCDPKQPLVNLNKAWRRIRARADLEDVRVHDLRRTAARLAGETLTSSPAMRQRSSCCW